MVEIVTKIDPRTKRERPVEKGTEDLQRVLRLVPRDDRIRKYIKHAITKVGFPKEGSCEWPNDQFTRNRLREGIITIEEKEEPQEGPRAVNRRTGAKGGDETKAT